MRLTLLVGLLCLTPAFAQDAKSPPKEPEVKKAPLLKSPENVAYHPDLTYSKLEKLQLELDLAVPKQGGGPFPTVIVIHGTGPLTKGRKNNVPLIFDYAKQGYVAAAISFRHNPKDAFPGAIEDAKCAVRWLRAHAKDYKVDGDRIGALGFSGGGSLACLLGACTAEDGLEGNGGHRDQSSRVQAVVSYFAPCDLAQLHADCVKVGGFQGWFLRGQLEQWLQGPPAMAKDRYAKASPIHYVRKEAAPLLLLHGSADTVVPIEHSRRLSEKMRTVGAKASFLTFAGAPHDFDEGNDDNARLAASAARSFLDEYLKPKAK